MKLPPMVPNKLGNPRKEPVTVLVVGAGGTGSQVLQQLGRIHVALRAMGRAGLMVEMMDDDMVTDANMARQLFVPSEVGRFKTDALIERVNRFYGTQWRSLPRRCTMDYVTENFVVANIIITCTDNVESRKIMHYNYTRLIPHQKNLHEAFKNHYWIDTGNSKDTGQIIVGSLIHKLPTVVDVFPDMEKYEAQDNTPSCSLAEALDHQDLFINTIIGQVTAMLVRDMVLKPVLTWYGAFINLNADRMINKRIGSEEQNKVPDSKKRKRGNNSPKAKSPRKGPKAAGSR